MRENMPDTHGWTDRGPAPAHWPRIPMESKIVRAVIEQGENQPRYLSVEERRLAQANRADAREAALQFEQWAASEFGVKPYSGRIPLHSEFIPDEIEEDEVVGGYYLTEGVEGQP